MRKVSGSPCRFLLTTLVLISACIDPGAAPEDEGPLLGTASSAVSYSASVTASPSSVELGQPVTASWVTAPEHSPSDWIGLFKVTAADNAWLGWQYVNGAGLASGTLVFTLPLTPSLDPGPYEFRYFSAGIKLATSNSFIGYANYSLTGTPASVELGQTASVTWNAPLAHSTSDWVGLFKSGAADNAYLGWKYVSGAGLTSGTLTFTVPLTSSLDPGPYEFRYFYGGIKRATSASFTGYAIYTLTDTPGSVELGQTASVTWHAPLAHSTSDWVGLFKSGAADNAFLGWKYVSGAGLTSGTLTFTVPLTSSLDPGPYEFRYFYGGIKRATSAGFTGYAFYTVEATSACRYGQPFGAAWTAPKAHPTSDYVGLYTATGTLVTYQYVGSAGLSSGAVTLTGASPGTYELRYVFGGKVTAVSAVSCTNP